MFGHGQSSVLWWWCVCVCVGGGNARGGVPPKSTPPWLTSSHVRRVEVDQNVGEKCKVNKNVEHLPTSPTRNLGYYYYGLAHITHT